MNVAISFALGDDGARSSRSGAFEAFFETLAGLSESAHLVRMFDSTLVRAHVSAAGAKGGGRMTPSDVRAVAFQRKSISRRISTVYQPCSS
jgi:hypothetical protein